MGGGDGGGGGAGASDRGLAPRALRDITAAAHAGRFQVDDCRPALSVAAGALMGLGRLLQDELDRDNAQAADKVHCRISTRQGRPPDSRRKPGGNDGSCPIGQVTCSPKNAKTRAQASWVAAPS